MLAAAAEADAPLPLAQKESDAPLEQERPLHVACSEGALPRVAQLLLQGTLDVNQPAGAGSMARGLLKKVRTRFAPFPRTSPAQAPRFRALRPNRRRMRRCTWPAGTATSKLSARSSRRALRSTSRRPGG